MTTLCDDVDEAVRWNGEVNNDIRRRVEEIQNETLEEEQTRELNDNINKLLCERKHWRRRIKQLGGSDEINEDEDEDFVRRKKFKRKNKRKRRGSVEKDNDDDDDDDEGNGVFEHDGYLYFGVAKTLPGVKQLIEAEKEERDRRRRRKRKGNSDDNMEDEGDEEMDLKILNSRLTSFYYDGIEENETSNNEERDNLKRIEKEYETNAMDEQIVKWEEKYGDDEEAINKYGKDSEWDECYLEHVDCKRLDGMDIEKAMNAIMLEKKKADALQLLEQGNNKTQST